MTILPKDLNNCPFLILAPMQGVGDNYFRKTISSIGGFNEAITDFIRVPFKGHVKTLAKKYNSNEIDPFPLIPQIMGSDPFLMAEMAYELEKRKAPKIDVNCGCPSGTVTKKGSGSSLLKDPNLVNKILKEIVKAVSIPVTVKMRSGYMDTSLFKENLVAAEESGISYLTLHPRTRLDGYKNMANWDLIAEAKNLLKIPIVGNGDIKNVKDAIKMLDYTNCDALMIGRGSLINPFIFQEIKSHFSKNNFKPSKDEIQKYIELYLKHIPKSMPSLLKINKMKQFFSYLFQSNLELKKNIKTVLSNQVVDFDSFLHHSLSLFLTLYE